MNHSWAAPSRRGLIGAGAGLAAGAAAQLLADKAEAARGMATLDQLKRAERDPDHRILLRGGIVLSLDPGIGNFEAGDVLIGGKKILAVGRNLNSTASVVDASGMIVMPGFVDTHHHQYETILRGTLADGVLGSPNDGKKTYQGVIQGIFTPVYQPEDAYISELVASLNQLNAGVTTTVDTSQVSPRRLHLLARPRPQQPVSERSPAAGGAILFIRRPAVDARAERSPKRGQLGARPASRRADHLPYRRR